MININKSVKYIGLSCIALMFTACIVPSVVQKKENKSVPASYNNSQDTVNTAQIKWKDFFSDSNLEDLIDEALQNNQELNIILQEINIAKQEVRARKGEYLPFVNLGAAAAADKTALYTRNGAVESNLDVKPGQAFPETLPDFMLGANASWEVDIWKKLRNAKKAALYRYLSTQEGKNFMVTHLISEIANSYYELMALDNQLEIVKKNIEILENALEIVKQLKSSAKVTELAVRKFEAEVLKNQSHQFYIIQSITETENRINFLVGRFPKPITRDSKKFIDLIPDSIHSGIPSQIMQNRPDIRQAEQGLIAAKLDVKVAKANFYPSMRLTAGIGYQAFNPNYLFTTPASMLYGLAGEIAAPLINRNALKATYYSANAKQIQAVYNYERTVLNAYVEVVNQLSMIKNLNQSYDYKSKQVQALTQSINISTNLFTSAKADYMEVLMTQRDALEAKIELVETKKEQMNAMVNVYKALGGGWR